MSYLEIQVFNLIRASSQFEAAVEALENALFRNTGKIPDNFFFIEGTLQLAFCFGEQKTSSLRRNNVGKISNLLTQ